MLSVCKVVRKGRTEGSVLEGKLEGKEAGAPHELQQCVASRFVALPVELHSSPVTVVIP